MEDAPLQPLKEVGFKYFLESLGTEFQRLQTDNDFLRSQIARLKSTNEQLIFHAPSEVQAAYKKDPGYLETFQTNKMRVRAMTNLNAQLSGDTAPEDEDVTFIEEIHQESPAAQDTNPFKINEAEVLESTDSTVKTSHKKVPKERLMKAQETTYAGKGSPMAAKLKKGAVGQFKEEEEAEGEKPVVETKVEPPKVWSAKGFVTDIKFDSFFGICIFANSIIMALDSQYKGIDDGYNISYPGSPRPASACWPGARGAFDALETFFGILFTLEVLLKVWGLRKLFIQSFWNWFDLVIVTIWYMEMALSFSKSFNPMLLRVLRLFRLLRLAKMIKKVQAFDSLQVLIGSIIASVPVLVWSAAVLLLFQMVAGMVLQSLLADFFAGDESIEDKREVYQYFGTFTRTIMTMSELTLSNWMTPTRKLVEKVSEWYALYCLLYKLTIGFAVVRVISGVFLHETFKVANSEDDLMIVQKRRMMHKHRTKMLKLLAEADSTNDGFVDRAELCGMLQNVNLKTWLAAQEVECNDGDILFDFLDGGDGIITSEELIHGVQRLKGAARSIDVNALIRMAVHMDSMIVALDDKVEIIDKTTRALERVVNPGSEISLGNSVCP